MPDIFDQNSDKSRKRLYGLARSLPEKTAALVLKTASNHTGGNSNYAWPEAQMFPTSSAEDTLLSRAYFTGQREKIAAETASAIDERLSAAEALYGMDNRFTKRPVVKIAHTKTAELLDGRYYVDGIAALRDAGKEFQEKYARLNMDDRIEFACNFIKTALDWGAEDAIPSMALVYSGFSGTDKDTLCNHLMMRKAACLRSGKDGSAYEMLAEHLKLAELDESTAMEKAALADAIHKLDDANGFTAEKYDRVMPDAYRIVFNKTAEESKPDEPAEQLPDKADLIGRYGEGVLDIVEDDEGNLIPEAVREVMKVFGHGQGEKKKDE